MEATGKGVSLRTLERRLAVVLIFCFFQLAAVGAVQHDKRGKNLVQETSCVLGALPPAYSNLTLPEAAVINYYLRNTKLRNYLLPSDPPLQLIKCEAYLLQRGTLFNFYVANHTKGCQVPPPLVLKPEEEYSAIGRFWIFKVRSWLSLGWLGMLAVLVITIGSTRRLSQICRSLRGDWQVIRFNSWLFGVTIVSVIASLLVTIALVASWEDAGYLQSFNLPEPNGEINPLLQISNISLSLQRCKAKDLFQFYIGMPEDMCAQILAAGAPYGKYLSEGPATWYDSGVSFISFLSSITTLSCSAVLCFDLVYLLFFVG